MQLPKYILEVVVFLCGMIVLIFEIVGSRVLAPYFGTSTFVWTSLIGVILASLSLGYYLGGRLADKKPERSILSHIILLASAAIIAMIIIRDPLLKYLFDNVESIKVGSIIAALSLFLPASILLGMVSPYALKLKIKSLSVAGRAAGDMSALSTAGSIFGTFLAGFYLIPFFGNAAILATLPFLLALLAIAIEPKKFLLPKFIAVVLSLFLIYISYTPIEIQEKSGIIKLDTIYNRITIFKERDQATNKMTLTLGINVENHSAMFLDSDDLVHDYTKYYHLARYFFPGFQSSLMLGGGGYSFPKDYIRKYPDASIDVVEIDPMITVLAEKYFRLVKGPHLHTYDEDGRSYIEKTDKKYDILFGDAFTSWYSIPYSLTTREAVQRKYDILTESGVVIENVISATEGEKGEFLRAEYATFKSVFPHVYLFPVTSPKDGSHVQNIILVALKNPQEPSFISNDPEIASYLSHRWTTPILSDMPILTDDYAPVDYYIGKFLRKS